MNDTTATSTANDSIVTPWAVLQLTRYNSSLLEGEDPRDVVRHTASDLRRVANLGNGAFCDVSLVISRSNKKQLAMKQLNILKTLSKSEFLNSVTDLLTEVQFLTKLDHPNIVKLRGISATPVSDSFEGDNTGFFFTMDVMEETLKSRLERWRNDPACYEKKKGYCKLLSKKQKKLNLRSMYDRVWMAALGVARAMNYVHQQGILHRDLKPSNIGFDAVTGRVCLFDFGFASELTDCCNHEICGTPRYMAPEVTSGKGYSLKSDVFSFGVILYEIASLERERLPKRSSNTDPYELPRPQTFSFRPSLKRIPCQDIANLIEDCLCSDPAIRPSFQDLTIAISDLSKPSIRGKQSLKSFKRSDSSFSLRSVATAFESASDLFGLAYDDDVPSSEQET